MKNTLEFCIKAEIKYNMNVLMWMINTMSKVAYLILLGKLTFLYLFLFIWNIPLITTFPEYMYV